MSDIPLARFFHPGEARRVQTYLARHGISATLSDEDGVAARRGPAVQGYALMVPPALWEPARGMLDGLTGEDYDGPFPDAGEES